LALNLWDNEDGSIVEPPRPLSGRILDSAGHPVEGAIITTGPGIQSAKSGQDGRFGFCEAIAGKGKLVIEHEGYRTRTIRLNSDNLIIPPFEIKLRKR
jgi:hypothetical protein